MFFSSKSTKNDDRHFLFSGAEILRQKQNIDMVGTSVANLVREKNGVRGL